MPLFTGWPKTFSSSAITCSLLFLLLEEDILSMLFWLHYFQNLKQKGYSLQKSMDHLNNLNIFFCAPALILSIDIYSSQMSVWNLISVALVALYYLHLIKLVLKDKSLFTVIAKVVALFTLQITQFAFWLATVLGFSRNYFSTLMAQLFLHSQCHYNQHHLRVLIQIWMN